MLDDLPQTAIQRLNGIGGVDHQCESLPDRQKNQSVARIALATGDILGY